MAWFFVLSIVLTPNGLLSVFLTFQQLWSWFLYFCSWCHYIFYSPRPPFRIIVLLFPWVCLPLKCDCRCRYLSSISSYLVCLLLLTSFFQVPFTRDLARVPCIDHSAFDVHSLRPGSLPADISSHFSRRGACIEASLAFYAPLGAICPPPFSRKHWYILLVYRLPFPFSLDLGEIKKDELPGPEALLAPGKFYNFQGFQAQKSRRASKNSRDQSRASDLKSFQNITQAYCTRMEHNSS